MKERQWITWCIKPCKLLGVELSSSSLLPTRLADSPLKYCSFSESIVNGDFAEEPSSRVWTGSSMLLLLVYGALLLLLCDSISTIVIPCQSFSTPLEARPTRQLPERSSEDWPYFNVEAEKSDRGSIGFPKWEQAGITIRYPPCPEIQLSKSGALTDPYKASLLS